MQSSVRRIYVRAPNWVGDLVMATSAFRRVREAFPKAHIACGIRPFLRPLLNGTTFFDEFLAAPKGGGLPGLIRQVRELREREFDLAVVLPNSLVTALVTYLAGIPRRLGYRQGRPGLLNLGLHVASNRRLWVRHGPRRVPKPMPYYYEELLDLLDVPRVELRPVLVTTEDERSRIERWLEERG